MSTAAHLNLSGGKSALLATKYDGHNLETLRKLTPLMVRKLFHRIQRALLLAHDARICLQLVLLPKFSDQLESSRALTSSSIIKASAK